jgi:alpha/beta superfamily hydrolase
MFVELIQVMTRDGVRLDGTLQVPAAGVRGQLAADAFLFVHGTGGNFYSSTFVDNLAERFLNLGSAVLRINTRGHDLMSTAATAEGGRRQGAAYELVDDCRHDLAAWIDWLDSRGYPRIGLVGHSLGAVKSIYALAGESHSNVVLLVALSPPRLSYSHFCASAEAPAFLETYAAAEDRVRADQASTLMEVKSPLPFVVTAGGYVEKYGPDERYNFLKFVARMPCPTLITFGGVELQSNMAFRELPDLLAHVVTEHGQLRVVVIPDADHFYSGQRAALVQKTEEWLRGI